MKHLMLAPLFVLALAALAHAQVKTGDPAPNFEGDLIHSDAKGLSDFKGQVVLVDFWRTW